MDEYELQLHIEFIKNAAKAKRKYIQKIKNINRDIKSNHTSKLSNRGTSIVPRSFAPLEIRPQSILPKN